MSKHTLSLATPEAILFITFCPKKAKSILSKSKAKAWKQWKERKYECLKLKSALLQETHCFQPESGDFLKEMQSKW
jgi:hypothetical protein